MDWFFKDIDFLCKTNKYFNILGVVSNHWSRWLRGFMRLIIFSQSKKWNLSPSSASRPLTMCILAWQNLAQWLFVARFIATIMRYFRISYFGAKKLMHFWGPVSKKGGGGDLQICMTQIKPLNKFSWVSVLEMILDFYKYFYLVK